MTHIQLVAAEFVRSSTDMNAAYQFTSQAYAWQDKMKESMEAGTGLKGAFEWRDGPYRDTSFRE